MGQNVMGEMEIENENNKVERSRKWEEQEVKGK